jgi:hypothetical protein
MTVLSKQEQVTALFVIGIYYWLIGDRLNAENAIDVACITATNPFGIA